MPPKKPATSSIVGEYDIELMTEQELKQYIEVLQEEHVRMRKACSLYSKDKIELLKILKNLQDGIIDRESIVIQKSLEIQELIKESEQKSKLEDALNRITKLEEDNKAERDTLESFIFVKSVELLNKEEEEALKKDINELDREIQHMEYIYKLMLIKLKEKDFEKYGKSSRTCKETFENIVAEYNADFLKITEEFSKSKIEKLQVILGDIPETNKNPFADFIAQMSEYFKNIYWKNLKTIEKLQATLMDLRKQLNTATLNLRDIIEVNNGIKNARPSPISPRNSFSYSPHGFSEVKLKTLEELTYDNYLLGIKLKMLNAEYSDLKEKFVSALRRIHQKADFKAFLLEKKLSALRKPPASLY